MHCLFGHSLEKKFPVSRQPIKFLPQAAKGDDGGLSSDVCLTEDEVEVWGVEVGIHDAKHLFPFDSWLSLQSIDDSSSEVLRASGVIGFCQIERQRYCFDRATEKRSQCFFELCHYFGVYLTYGLKDYFHASLF